MLKDWSFGTAISTADEKEEQLIDLLAGRTMVREIATILRESWQATSEFTVRTTIFLFLRLNCYGAFL